MPVKKSTSAANPKGEVAKSDSETPFKLEEPSEQLTKEVGSIEPSELEKIMQELQALREKVSKIEDRPKAIVEGTLDADGIDPVEDYLEVPAVFFSFSFWYGIYSDKRYNREVLPPRKEPIIFKQLYRWKKKSSSRGVEVVSISQATVRSKSTAEWLRNHSLFNIKFFENIQTAQNVNVTLAEKMAEMNGMISSLNDHQVIERAQREGMPIVHSDVQTLRKELIQKLAEHALKEEKRRHEITLQNANFDDEGRIVEYYKGKNE